MFGSEGFLQTALGTSALEGLANNNALLPLAALAGFVFVRSLLRTGRGLLPMAALVLLMLGRDPGVMNLAGAAGGVSLPAAEAVLPFDPAALLERDGLALPLLVVLAVLWLGRGSILSLGGLLPLIALGIILSHRDFRLSSLLSDPVRAPLLYLGGGVLALMVALRWLSRGRYRYYNQIPLPVRIGLWLAPLKPYLGHLLGVSCGGLTLLMVMNPAGLEAIIPGWRTTLGLGLLMVTLLGLARSLPERVRVYLTPLYWGFLVVVLIGQVMSEPALLRATPAPSSLPDASVGRF